MTTIELLALIFTALNTILVIFAIIYVWFVIKEVKNKKEEIIEESEIEKIIDDTQ